MTEAQTQAVERHLSRDRSLWYEHQGAVYLLVGQAKTDVYVTISGNVRLGNRTLVRPDGRTSPVL